MIMQRNWLYLCLWTILLIWFNVDAAPTTTPTKLEALLPKITQEHFVLQTKDDAYELNINLPNRTNRTEIGQLERDAASNEAVLVVHGNYKTNHFDAYGEYVVVYKADKNGYHAIVRYEPYKISIQLATHTLKDLAGK